MRKSLLLTIIAFCLIAGANAQLSFTNYANQNNINCLLEDGNRIWIGTTGGLILRNKGTGALIASYTSNNGLSNNDISSLALDVDGNLWVGTRMGVSKYNGSTWTKYTSQDGLISDWVTSLAFDLNGNLWVTAIGGVSKFNGVDWTGFSNYNTGGMLSTYVYNVAVDNANNKWFTTDAGLMKYNDASWLKYNTVNSNIAYDYTCSLAIDPNNNIWVGYMSNAGVTKFDGTNWTTNLTNTNINTISSDASGNMWFGTGSGLTKYDGTTWTTYSTSNSGIISNWGKAIVVDAQGNKWYGSEKGLSRFDNTTWTNFTINNTIVDNDVQGIAIDSQNNKWFATFYGLAKLTSNNTWTNYTAENTSNGLPSNQLYAVAFDYNQSIWAGTSNGIVKFNGSTWVKFLNGIQVNSIYIDPSSGVVWAGTSNGVYSYNGSSFNVHYTTANELIDNEVLTIEKDYSGNMWFGTRHGISRRTSTGTWSDFSFSVSGWSSSDWIMAIKTDPISHNIWVATLYQGAYEYDGTAWTNYTASNSGITDNMIYGLNIDNLGNKWFATYGSGISKFDGVNWANYDISKGLVGEFTRVISIDSDGNKWIGSTSGVSKATCVTPNVDFAADTICYAIGNTYTTFSNLTTKIDATTKYQWDINNDGSVEYTTAGISHSFLGAGTYNVKLTAINDQCSNSIVKSVFVNTQPQVEIIVNGGTNICDGTSTNLSSNILNNIGSGVIYLWSNGETGSSIEVYSAGIYSLTVTNGNCSGASNQVFVNVKTPYNNNQICMVTVDSLTGKNMIMWEKPTSISGIQSYNIYKVIGTNYVLIDNVPFDAMSMYKDFSSYPESNYSRYAISAVDSCGNESDKSPYHQTINLISAYNPSNSSVGLIWNHYIDESGVFIPEFYYIYRGTNIDNLQLYQSVDGIVTSYNDVAPGVNKYYRISVTKPDACYPSSSAKSISGPFSQSISNVDENIMATSITNFNNETNVNIYPNPFAEQTTISFDNSKHLSYRLIITTITGEVVRSIDDIKDNKIIIDRGNLASGLYLLELQGENNYRGKMIIE